MIRKAFFPEMSLKQAQTVYAGALVIARLRAIALLLSQKSSDAQPRDDHGGWTSGSTERSNADVVVRVAGNDGAPRSRDAQQKQFNDVIRILKLDADQTSQLDDAISHQNLKFQDVMAIGKIIKSGQRL